MELKEIIIRIIEDQSMIVGEQLAKSQAVNSGVVEIGPSGLEDIKLKSADTHLTLEKIVSSYEKLFGQASVNVCLNTLRKLPKTDLETILPESLKAKVA